MNKLTLTTMLATCALFPAPGSAADAAAGKAKAEESCADCHGDDGAGDEDYPGIAGMSVEKFTKAMQEYQSGTRSKSPKMTKEAKKLELLGFLARGGVHIGDLDPAGSTDGLHTWSAMAW